MEEEDLERLLEEEGLQKEQEDSQVVQQLYEQGTGNVGEYCSELVGGHEDDDDLEALLDQELEQKQTEDEIQTQLSVDEPASKESSHLDEKMPSSTDCALSARKRVFQVEEFPVKPSLTRAQDDWRENTEQPPLALQWTQEELDLFCQQVVRLGPSAMEQPWLLAKTVQSKNALECLLLYEALFHKQYEVQFKLHPIKFVVQKKTYPKSRKLSASHFTWEKLVQRYQCLVTSTIERGFPTPSRLRSYEPWSPGFWLRLSVKERRLLALADWHILLSYCNSLRSSTCPPIVGADPRVFVRILANTCDYMRYITRVALSLAIAQSKMESLSAPVVMTLNHVSRAVEVANEYYRYGGNFRVYLGMKWMTSSIQEEFAPSYDILEENVDTPLPLDDFYDLVLVDYGWLDGKRHYVCVPKYLQVVPVTDLYFYQEWWHPQRHPSWKNLSKHLLVRRLVQRWFTLWLGEKSISEKEEARESYEYCAHPLTIAQTNNCQVPLLCRQWICNAGCYYLAYQCRQLVKYLCLVYDTSNYACFQSLDNTESNNVYFEYFHWHMLQMHLEKHP